MTIAACYVSSEGVVLGADSTSTLFVAGPTPAIAGSTHHLNYAQKIFEIGQESTLGITMWGLGAIADLSYRTLISTFADSLQAAPVVSVENAAARFASSFWAEYSARLATFLNRYQTLQSNPSLTPDEESEMLFLENLMSGGFCIGGHAGGDRTPRAFAILYGPQLTGPPPVAPLNMGEANFWGCPNTIERVIFGIDTSLFDAILNSGHWTATGKELIELVIDRKLAQPSDLPLREAIDWVHAVIYTTIKAMKFSHYSPICGGPIEIAVISSDRLFRWVKHKQFDEALR